MDSNPIISQGICTAPGKLIISGEHSVVYGKSALVMAVNKYITIKFVIEKIP